MSTVLDALSFICLVSGALFCAIGGFGLVRLPDLYTRTHAATITDTLGAGLVLLGLMIQGGLSNVTIKLIMVLLFIYFTSPVAGHALVKAAFASGLRAKLAPDAPPHPRTSRPPEPAETRPPSGRPASQPPPKPAEAPQRATDGTADPSSEGGDGDDAP